MAYQDLSNSRNPSTDLLMTEYVSFGHVVQSNQDQSKYRKASEISNNITPTFKKELSLFPLFDKFLLYTPCFVIKDRDKKFYIPMFILIIIAFILRFMNHALYFMYLDKEHNEYNSDLKVEIFVALMFILPFINNIIRLRYFVNYFNFNTWHYPSYINPKSGVKTINNTILNRLSFLLRRPAYAKNKISKSFRKGWIGIMIIIITQVIFKIILTYKYGQNYIYFYQVNSLSMLIYSIIWSFLYAFVFDIPDVLCLLVCRIILTECQLAITHFIEELKSMSLDEIGGESNIFHKYIIMNKEINDNVKHFHHFISIMAFTVLLGIWYGINYILSTETWTVKQNDDAVLLYIILWIISTLLLALQLMFALYPAFKMNQLNHDLLENVNIRIDDIMFNRQQFHKESMLNDFMDIVCKKQRHKKSTMGSLNYQDIKFNDKTEDLKNKISKYSIQKSALDILSSLLIEIEEHPCTISLFGIEISYKSVKDIIIGLIISQILSLLWGAA